MFSNKSNKQKNKSYEKSIMVSRSNLHHRLGARIIRNRWRNGNGKSDPHSIGNCHHCRII